MLNIAKQGTYQDSTGYQWVFYQDDATENFFYIIPRPQFAFDQNNDPIFQIVRYATDDASNGSGYCHIGVELTVPQSIETSITASVERQFGVRNPQFQALQYNPGGTAYLNFTSQGPTIVFTAATSSFGSNAATFLLPMTKSQLDSVQAAFTTAGGTYEVQYQLTVPARLPAVNATLQFDSAIAYRYQVTQPQSHMWGSDTPGSTEDLLAASQSSTVTITWGEANPPVSLQEAVATWANTTLATLVNASVEEQLQLQGLTSSESFNINTVNSFTENYVDNQVVNWIIQPQALLPSLTDLGLNINDFIATVNEQQQVMTVTTNAPFQADAQVVAATEFAEVLVESMTVTVSYPGLPQAQSTYTFTSNGSAVFLCPYDTSQGPTWSLTYSVMYAAPASPVTGTINNIDQASYVLSITEVGIINVTFDASQAFTASTGPNALDQVLISLTFQDVDGAGNFINQQLTIDSTDTVPRVTFTSLVGVPLTTTYNYTVTFDYVNEFLYTAPTVTGNTGFYQTIYAPAAVHSTEILIVLPNNDPSQILEAYVDVWYPAAPNIPNIGQQPTKSNPTQFHLVPTNVGSFTWANDTFEGFIKGHEPLMYSVTINAVTGQTLIDDVMIENDQPSVEITTTQRYFTLQIDPSAIDWSAAVFESIQVLVNPTVNGVAQPQRAFTWNMGERSPQYLTVSMQTGQPVSYTWTATYITRGQATQKTESGSSSDVMLAIPGAPST